MRTITVPDVTPSTINMVEVPSEPIILSKLSQIHNLNLKLHYLSRAQSIYPEESASRMKPDTTYPPFSAFLITLHTAYNHHISFSLSPETLWYIICHEIAIHIKQNPARYAEYFTDNPGGKTLLSVQADKPNDWYDMLQRFNYALRQKLPPTTHHMFLPPFSTLTPESEGALLVSLLDQASSYYEYQWVSVCGIPSIRLEGTEQDWEMLYNHTLTLSQTFTDLRAYFTDLLPVLTTLNRAAHGEAFPDEDAFWKSIYKLNQQSGGPYITGWITAFFAYSSTKKGPVQKQKYDWCTLERYPSSGYKMNQFPVHLSLVPFTWQRPDKEVKMGLVAGVTGNEYQDGYLTPRLGYGVVE